MPDTDKQLHTSEPFVVVPPEIAQTWGYNKEGLNGYYGVQQDNDGFCVAIFCPDIHHTEGSAKGNVDRFVSCVNALAGLNPDGVAELVEAANALIDNIYEECGDLSNVREEYKALETALANVKGNPND